MYTLVIRLAGPLQAWGTDSKFEIRRTENMPTKSGLVGLLANALGRRRDDRIDDLKKLHLSILIEKPGVEITDFHTAKSAKTSYITTRHYLSDAEFLAGLESESREELEKLVEALKYPARPLYLGRRSCPPTLPLIKGIYEGPAPEVLASLSENTKGDTATVYCEGRHSDDLQVKMDEPESFDFHYRQYSQRMISTLLVPIKTENKDDGQPDIFATEQDPMEALKEEF